MQIQDVSRAQSHRYWHVEAPHALGTEIVGTSSTDPSVEPLIWYEPEFFGVGALTTGERGLEGSSLHGMNSRHR